MAEGPEVIVVWGGTVSTVQLRAAGVGSTFQAGSAARTWSVCGPCERPTYCFGEEHAANAPASNLHSKLDWPSLDEKVNCAEADLVIPDGPELIVVCGGVVSAGGTLCGPVVGPGVRTDAPDQ